MEPKDKEKALLQSVMSVTESIVKELRALGYEVSDPEGWSNGHVVCFASASASIKCEVKSVKINVTRGEDNRPCVYIAPYDDESLDRHCTKSVDVMFEAYRVVKNLMEGTGVWISVSFTYLTKGGKQ